MSSAEQPVSVEEIDAVKNRVLYAGWGAGFDIRADFLTLLRALEERTEALARRDKHEQRVQDLLTTTTRELVDVRSRLAAYDAALERVRGERPSSCSGAIMSVTQRLRDIAHGLNSPSNQATLREAAECIEQLEANCQRLSQDRDSWKRNAELSNHMTNDGNCQGRVRWTECGTEPRLRKIDPAVEYL